jgi:outer membrane protein OmpA-like peptidoglycan-associated protein
LTATRASRIFRGSTCPDIRDEPEEDRIMNTRSKTSALSALAALSLAALPALAADVQLATVQFPEGKGIDLKMIATNRVAPAEAEADVKFKEGQASVRVDASKLPPAILFGGDVTSYVTWAVGRDGTAENLGELIVRGTSARGEYRTGQKEFGLVVTAEPYALVLKPSELVAFTSVAPPPKKAKSTPITLSSLAIGAPHGNQQIGGMSFTGKEPLDLVQAQNVLAQARAIGAERYAPDAVRDAELALAQATNSFKGPGGSNRAGVDYARRSLSLSSTAIRDTNRQLDEAAAAEAAAKRAAQMQALEQQKVSAQQQALSAREQALAAREQAAAAQAELGRSQQQLAQAQQQATAAQQQMSTLQAQARQAQADAASAQERAATAGLSADAADAARREAEESRRRAEALAAQAQSAKVEAERTTAEASAAAAALESQKALLESENTRLKRERDDLAGQLNGALSSVAQIRQSARGIVVNLPDILFDTNKATLKPNAQVAMGKLAGIVSLFPNINLRIEGHTDSTGTDAINDKLSKDRADAVMAFLQGQGVAAARMTDEGYGSRTPIADNATSEGRAKNRRVEIILAPGVIPGQ